MKIVKTKLFLALFISSFFLFGLAGTTEVKALDIIPGLKGFGTDTRAAYGAANDPEICVVNSLGTGTGPGDLSWDSSYGPNNIGVFKGTLIQCLEGLDTLGGETIDGHIVKPNSGKVVLFETSGTIRQIAANDDDNTFRYKVGSYTTMAGQTSPKPGITFRNICIFGAGVNDVLIQHVRGRMDGPPTTHYGLHKSFTFPSGFSDPTYNIVVDHVSGAWGEDGQIAFFKQDDELHDITVSNCIMSEARENMGLTGEESNNGKNCLFGGQSGQGYNFLAYANLLSNTKKRNPAIFNARAAVVNNYMYNLSESSVTLNAVAGPGELSLVGNVVDAGPMSGGHTTIDDILYLGWSQWQLPVSQNKVYLYDNKTEAGTQANSTAWDMNTLVYANNNNSNAINGYLDFKVTGEVPSIHAPIWPAGLNLMSSSEVKNYIIANAGAYPAFRDSLDARFINEMITGTGPSGPLQGSPAPGDWPVLAVNTITLAIPNNPHDDDNGNGYTNLEEWLHCLACDVEGRVCPECSAPITSCDYFVRNGGNNVLDGRSEANAWATISYVNLQNFADGDVICLKRGSTFTDATLTLDSTSVGRSGIVVQDYGVGNKPWINGNSVQPILINHALVDLTLKNIDISGSDAVGFSRCQLKDINGLTIDGLDYNGHTGSSSYVRSTAITVSYVDGDIEIKNCHIQNVMKDTWGNTTSAWGSLDAHAIIFWYVDDAKVSGIINVHDNIIHDIYSDCAQTTCVQTTCNIYNNQLYNFGENAVDHKKGRYINVYNNSISSGGVKEGTGTSIGGGAGTPYCLAHTAQDITIRDNYFYDTPTIGIFISAGGMNNYNVYGNYFKDVGLGIVVGNAANTNIYNNVFDLSKPVESSFSTVKRSGIRVMYSEQSNTKIYNNSFYISSANHLYGIAVQADADATGAIIKNNIIHMTRGDASVFPLYIEDYDNSGNLPIVQNNLLYGAHSNRVRIEEVPGSWVTYDSSEQALWTSAGHTGALFTNPQFTNPSAGDLALQSTSPAINAGANLGSPYNMGLNSASTWPNNVHTLNQSDYGSWEIGAFVYADVPIPDPDPASTCEAEGYQCCASCQSGSHPEYNGDCLGQVCCEVCSLPPETCASESGICCAPLQICQDGLSESLSSCSNICCIGGTCAYPASPTCQSKEYQCCASCLSGPHLEYSSDCSGEEKCCEVCYVKPPSSLIDLDIKNPVKASNFAELIENTIMWTLSIVGSLALLILIFGGVMYIGSSGDEQKVLTAKKIVTYAIIGLILILLSYAIVVILEGILI